MAERGAVFRPAHMRSRAEANEAFDARRKQEQPWRKWYHTARWKKLRLVQLGAFPLCAACLAKGIVTEATVVHHMERHRGDAQRFWDGPFESVCETCHNRDKQQAEARGRFGFSIPDGMRPSAVLVHLVVGPPGSGKSTFVKREAKAGDVVIDMDDIRKGLGFTRHDSSREALHAALTERNRMIEGLWRAAGCEAWLIASCPTMAERKAWGLALGKMRMHVMAVSEAECRRRIMCESDEEKRSPMRLKALRGWHAAAVCG